METSLSSWLISLLLSRSVRAVLVAASISHVSPFRVLPSLLSFPPLPVSFRVLPLFWPSLALYGSLLIAPTGES